ANQSGWGRSAWVIRSLTAPPRRRGDRVAVRAGYPLVPNEDQHTPQTIPPACHFVAPGVRAFDDVTVIRRTLLPRRQGARFDSSLPSPLSRLLERPAAPISPSEMLLTNSAEVRTRSAAFCPAFDRSKVCRRD